MNDLIRSAAYSQDPALANAVVLGELVEGGPCFLDLELLKKPGHVLGPTGSGKTICLHSGVNQVAMRQTPAYREFARRAGIEWEPTSIVFLTFVKGPDDRERNYLAEIATRAKMRFQSFEPTTGEWTHLYPTHRQKFYSRMGKGERAEHIAQCLGLTGSEEYGQKYFAGKDVSLLIKAEKVGGPFKSYWDQLRFLTKKGSMKRMGLTKRDRENADQVIDHIRIIASITPMNEFLRPGGPPQAAFDEAIDFGEAFMSPHLIYVNLDGLGDKRAFMAASQILFDLKQASQTLRKERQCRVLFIADEADMLVRSPGVVGLLNRVRHRNLSIILAHQYAEQTDKHGMGIDVNAAWHLDFSLPTPEAVEKMQRHAPDDLTYLLSMNVEPASTDRDDVRHAVQTAVLNANASERWEPRYSKNTVIGFNRTGRVGWLRARYDSGATRINGVAPFVWSYSMTAEQWKAYGEDRFSPVTPAMIQVPLDDDFPDAEENDENEEDRGTRRRKPREPEVQRAPGSGTAAGDAAIDRHFAERSARNGT